MMALLEQTKIQKAKYAKRVNGKMQFVDKDEPTFTNGAVTYHITDLRELAFWACELNGCKFISAKEDQLKEDVNTLTGLTLDRAIPEAQGDELITYYTGLVWALMKLQESKKGVF